MYLFNEVGQKFPAYIHGRALEMLPTIKNDRRLLMADSDKEASEMRRRMNNERRALGATWKDLGQKIVVKSKVSSTTSKVISALPPDAVWSEDEAPIPSLSDSEVEEDGEEKEHKEGEEEDGEEEE
jgi:hypothetical protein